MTTYVHKHVLVVDNVDSVLDAVKFNLTQAGYTVFTARSIQQAQELLVQEIMHVAVVDIRLENDSLVKDRSGFDFARSIPAHIPFIIYTGYKDLEHTEIALGDIGARRIIDKGSQLTNAATELVTAIDDLFREKVQVNFKLELHSSLSLDTVAKQIRMPDTDEIVAPTQEDIQEILRRSFLKALMLNVDPLLSNEDTTQRTQSGAVLLKVRSKRSDGWTNTRVVKIGIKEEIEREQRNYAEIEPFLGGNRRAELRSVAFSRSIGGIVYSLIDTEKWDTIRVFDDVFWHEDTENTIALLRTFFQQTFGQLFADAPRERLSLTAMYTQELHLTPDKLRTIAEVLRPGITSAYQLGFRGIKGSFWNPITWIMPNNQFREFEALSRQCLCHGDLHGRNILVDDHNRFWLIDFARVGQSHALRDFVQLETDIKFHLLQVTDLSVLLPFEHSLLEATSFADTLTTPSFTNPNLERAYHVIVGLRKMAHELIILDGNMREYYWALLLHTLKISQLPHINSSKKEHALLAASLLCQRLDQWPEWDVSLPKQSAPETNTTMQEKKSSDDSPATDKTANNYQHVSKWDMVAVATSVVVGIPLFVLLMQMSSFATVALFFLIGTVVIAISWWAMYRFKPDWQSHLALFIYLSLFIVTSFGLLGLVSGEVVVNTIQEMITAMFN